MARKAAELIDMSRHAGEHPRIGAIRRLPDRAGFRDHDGRYASK
jgi:hypothetical protein